MTQRRVLAGTRDFKYGMGAEIMWQVTNATTEFFNQRGTVRAVIDMSLIISQVRGGHDVKSQHKPKMFEPPVRKDKDGEGTKKRNKDDWERTRADNRNKRPKAERFHERKVEAELAAAFKEWKSENRSKFWPSMSKIKQSNNCIGAEEFAKKLGVGKEDCQQYCYYGFCTFKKCTREHPKELPNFKTKEAVDMWKKTTAGKET